MGHIGDMTTRQPPQVASSGLGSGLLNTEAAARYLATTPRHVRELWATRRLAGIKVGRLVRFHPCDLDRYVEAHRTEAVR